NAISLGGCAQRLLRLAVVPKVNDTGIAFLLQAIKVRLGGLVGHRELGRNRTQIIHGQPRKWIVKGGFLQHRLANPEAMANRVPNGLELASQSSVEYLDLNLVYLGL